MAGHRNYNDDGKLHFHAHTKTALYLSTTNCFILHKSKWRGLTHYSCSNYSHLFASRVWDGEERAVNLEIYLLCVVCWGPITIILVESELTPFSASLRFSLGVSPTPLLADSLFCCLHHFSALLVDHIGSEYDGMSFVSSRRYLSVSDQSIRSSPSSSRRPQHLFPAPPKTN